MFWRQTTKLVHCHWIWINDLAKLRLPKCWDQNRSEEFWLKWRIWNEYKWEHVNRMPQTYEWKRNWKFWIRFFNLGQIVKMIFFRPPCALFQARLNVISAYCWIKLFEFSFKICILSHRLFLYKRWQNNFQANAQSELWLLGHLLHLLPEAIDERHRDELDRDSQVPVDAVASKFNLMLFRTELFSGSNNVFI